MTIQMIGFSPFIKKEKGTLVKETTPTVNNPSNAYVCTLLARNTMQTNKKIVMSFVLGSSRCTSEEPGTYLPIIMLSIIRSSLPEKEHGFQQRHLQL